MWELYVAVLNSNPGVVWGFWIERRNFMKFKVYFNLKTMCGVLNSKIWKFWIERNGLFNGDVFEFEDFVWNVDFKILFGASEFKDQFWASELGKITSWSLRCLFLNTMMIWWTERLICFCDSELKETASRGLRCVWIRGFCVECWIQELVWSFWVQRPVWNFWIGKNNFIEFEMFLNSMMIWRIERLLRGLWIPRLMRFKTSVSKWSLRTISIWEEESLGLFNQM